MPPMGDYAEEQFLGLPTAGDFDMGSSISTAALQNPNTSISNDQRRIASGSPWMQSPGVWIAIVLALVGLKYIVERAGGKEDFKSIRIGIETSFVVFLMAAVWFYAFKTSVNAIPGVPGPIKQFAGAI